MAGGASFSGAVGHYDPGRDAAERYPDWVIRHRDLRGIPEMIHVEHRVILLDDSQSRSAKRSSLAHAIAHLDLDHVTIDGHLGARQESEAEQLAALRLITVPALADAIRWCDQQWPAVAAVLDVDERLLQTRLNHMHPTHRGQLKELLASHLEFTTA